MRKLLSISLFSVLFIITTIRAGADNYRYELYDPDTSKTLLAEMITIASGENSYCVGLFYGDVVCMIDNKANKAEQGYISGNCYGITPNNAKHKYIWKELKKNSYNSEVQDIIKERKPEGLNLETFK